VTAWRPIRIGIFWYATRCSMTGERITLATRNWVLREDCAAYCTARNREDPS
jgi:hypothetical protein